MLLFLLPVNVYEGSYGFVTQVFRCSFLMKHYGHDNPKRTTIISTKKMVGELDRGTLPRSQAKSKYPTAYSYIDRNGKRRFVGHRTNLRKSGQHASNLKQYACASENKFFACCLSVQLARIYPLGFAKKIVSLLPRLQAHEVHICYAPGLLSVCAGAGSIMCACWDLAVAIEDEDSSLQELCDQLSYNHKTWEIAGLEPVVRYLRGGKSLAVPEEWRGCLQPFL